MAGKTFPLIPIAQAVLGAVAPQVTPFIGLLGERPQGVIPEITAVDQMVESANKPPVPAPSIGYAGLGAALDRIGVLERQVAELRHAVQLLTAAQAVFHGINPQGLAQDGD